VNGRRPPTPGSEPFANLNAQELAELVGRVLGEPVELPQAAEDDSPSGLPPGYRLKLSAHVLGSDSDSDSGRPLPPRLIDAWVTYRHFRPRLLWSLEAAAISLLLLIAWTSLAKPTAVSLKVGLECWSVVASSALYFALRFALASRALLLMGRSLPRDELLAALRPDDKGSVRAE
jgi:hypothetical protein